MLHPHNRRKMQPTVKRARICIFGNETSTVFVSAASTAVIIARIEGDFQAVFAPDVPVYWLPEEDMVEALGVASWEVAMQRLNHCLTSMPVADWDGDKLLAALRRIFPTIEVQTLDAVEPAG